MAYQTKFQPSIRDSNKPVVCFYSTVLKNTRESFKIQLDIVWSVDWHDE